MVAGPQGTPDAGLYTAAEVVFLLALNQKQAEELSEGFVDSVAHLAEDPDVRGGAGEDSGVLVIARWRDVHEARDRARARAEPYIAPEDVDRIVALSVHGYTQREIADQVEISQATVHRRIRGMLDLILEELGGEAEPAVEQLDRPTMCLICGDRPRARLRERFVRRRGEGWVVARPERQLSVCAECVSDELRDELVIQQTGAAE